MSLEKVYSHQEEVRWEARRPPGNNFPVISSAYGLDNGLTFAELTISQGTGDYASHTLVRFGAEYLLILQNISVTSITSPDFTPVSIDESLH